jgi:uncharacterized Fe-S cluster-containing radical SAM superfamily protein
MGRTAALRDVKGIKRIPSSSPACRKSAAVKEYSVFFKEWLAGGRPLTQLPISAVCNSRCIFCSNHLNPFPVARGLFRDIEDVKLQLALMDEHYRQAIRLSDSLPGRIAEGEAFLHPQFFDILRVIRRKFPTNLLCFTTNGSMLDEAFVKELSRSRPIEITLSMHSTRPDLWAAISGKDESSAATAMNAPRLIKEHRMDLRGTIVPLPRICGWQDIENTYGNFVSRGAKAMILFWPGHSVCSSPDAVKKMECPLEEFMDFVDRMREQYDIPITPHPYTRGRLGFDVEMILSATRKGNVRNRLGPYRNVLWLASEAAHERIRGEIEKRGYTAGNTHAVTAVRNETYGGNIIASGLLMVDDFVRSGQEALRAHPDTELILVPKTPFDCHLRDLKGDPAYRIAEELKRPVWVVAENGAIHRLLEKVFERKEDSPTAGVKKLMEQFNRALKDETAIDSSLDLVHAFPVRTPWGLLTREELRDAILGAREGHPDGEDPLFQTFQLLDGSHALCTEKWPCRDTSPAVLRWTFLLKKEDGWRIDYISQSAMEVAPCS